MGDLYSTILSQMSPKDRWLCKTFVNSLRISRVVQNHVKLVYLALSCAVTAAVIGAYLHILWNIGGFLTTVACLGSIIWLLFTPPYEEEKKRVSLLLALSLFLGASIGPLIDLAIEVDPSLIFTALVGTSLAFACFSAAAWVTRRREYLYLGGFLSSGLSILVWLDFASSIFAGAPAFYKSELFSGLLVFVGYIVLDTQKIIERAHLGDLDYVKHALILFIDFAAIFVRILKIVLKNSAEKNEKKKKRRRLNAGPCGFVGREALYFK